LPGEEFLVPQGGDTPSDFQEGFNPGLEY